MMMQIAADSGNHDVIVALDALFEGRIMADLLIGLPATVALGSDRYSAKIVKVTAKTITVEMCYGNLRTFRNTKRGWRHQKHYHLCIGYAEDYSPREEMGY